MSSRLIENFEEPEMAYQFIATCKDIHGLDVIFTCVDRSYIEQAALFAQGREPLDYVNNLRKLAGMPKITLEENRRKVTWTMNSKHIVNLDDERLDNNKSRALDFCILNKGKASWDIKADVDQNMIPDYIDCANVAKAIGFKSGSDFKNPDYPHIELP